MTTKSDLFESLTLPDDHHRAATVIDGLGFASNYLLEHRNPEIHLETKILSNPGSIVGHFVTHGIGFRYSTFSVHVGQVDRLTFHSATPKRVKGYFIDCRRDSPSRGHRLVIEFATSAWRKLIVPGSQYVSIRYSERLAEAGVEPSVGSKGDSYDNALAETINGLYKAEVIHRRTWKTREAVELATLTWVSWFNNHRLMGPLGYIPPAEAEANYDRQLAEQSACPA